jgi:hypothetical protein
MDLDHCRPFEVEWDEYRRDAECRRRKIKEAHDALTFCQGLLFRLDPTIIDRVTSVVKDDAGNVMGIIADGVLFGAATVAGAALLKSLPLSKITRSIGRLGQSALPAPVEQPSRIGEIEAQISRLGSGRPSSAETIRIPGEEATVRAPVGEDAVSAVMDSIEGTALDVLAAE